MDRALEELRKKGLYDARFEHDNCGIGAIVEMDGKPSHALVADALSIVENLEHRAGKDAEGKTGDGVGILTQIPHKFFKKVMAAQGVELGEETGCQNVRDHSLKKRSDYPWLEKCKYQPGSSRKQSP